MEPEQKSNEQPEAEFVPEDGEGAVETAQAKLERLRDELKQCQTDKQEYLAMSQRLKADYLNAKRETDIAQAELAKFATEPILRDLIELADSFELAFVNQEVWQKVDVNWRKGVEYIHAKLENLMQKYNLIEIPALGETFDPLKHHALELVDSTDTTQANRVREVVQKGYTLHGKVVRPAQVKVNS